MCGIAGIIKFHSEVPAPWHRGTPDLSALEAMSAAIAHRGPDGAGLYTDPRSGKTAALIHRRLAIIDLPGGAQPMPNEDGTVHVVFNGEIYNHAELRRDLQRAGHVFRSDHSDTEVLVHGWEEWGTELPERLVGMFAFAVWDMRHDPAAGGTRDTLFLARDRMGQKPLFYGTLEDGIVFGSTIPSVLAWPEMPRRIPREQVALYLTLGYLPPPQTIWRDISQVVPGHWLRLRRDVLDGGRYWSPAAESQSHRTTSAYGKPGEAAAEVRALLGAAVESQLIADVPIACFLSGGIDSSVIAALMQQAVLRRGGEPIHTVSVGFTEEGFDETKYAAAVAQKIGSRHTRLQVDVGQNVLETLQALMRTSLGEPFADSSIVPTHHLSRAVREIAPVALSGDGADELFAGYDRYRAMLLLQRWRGVAKLLPESAPVGSLSKRERFRRLGAAAREAKVADQYARLVDIFAPGDVATLLGETPDLAMQDADATPLRHAMFRDQRDYLPGDVLWKVDSAAMACALEVRSPFLDHRVVAFANGLPESMLIEQGQGKRILREAFAKELPPEIMTRSKQGFGAPFGDWFRGNLRWPLNDLLVSPDSFAANHLNRQAVRTLLDEHQGRTRDHTHRLFALFMLEIWRREFKGTIE